jgi:hypothetical protein
MPDESASTVTGPVAAVPCFPPAKSVPSVDSNESVRTRDAVSIRAVTTERDTPSAGSETGLIATSSIESIADGVVGEYLSGSWLRWQLARTTAHTTRQIRIFMTSHLERNR